MQLEREGVGVGVQVVSIPAFFFFFNFSSKVRTGLGFSALPESGPWKPTDVFLADTNLVGHPH